MSDFFKKWPDIFAFMQGEKVIQKGDIWVLPLENHLTEGEHSVMEYDSVKTAGFKSNASPKIFKFCSQGVKQPQRQQVHLHSSILRHSRVNRMDEQSMCQALSPHHGSFCHGFHFWYDQYLMLGRPLSAPTSLCIQFIQISDPQKAVILCVVPYLLTDSCVSSLCRKRENFPMKSVLLEEAQIPFEKKDSFLRRKIPFFEKKDPFCQCGIK